MEVPAVYGKQKFPSFSPENTNIKDPSSLSFERSQAQIRNKQAEKKNDIPWARNPEQGRNSDVL